MQFLLDHGADINARNSDGDIPLDITLAYGKEDVAELLHHNKSQQQKM